MTRDEEYDELRCGSRLVASTCIAALSSPPRLGCPVADAGCWVAPGAGPVCGATVAAGGATVAAGGAGAVVAAAGGGGGVGAATCGADGPHAATRVGAGRRATTGMNWRRVKQRGPASTAGWSNSTSSIGMCVLLEQTEQAQRGTHALVRRG